MDISVVIRTYNEARHLGQLLEGLDKQDLNGMSVETVLVDSGSTDDTVTIAQRYGCRIMSIRKEEFSFGRSLNIGCEASAGEFIVIVSGHCVPADNHWIAKLVEPLLLGSAQYVYGRQIGNGDTSFSEKQIFRKYFPRHSSVPQDGFYCNNANAAIVRDIWTKYRFNEELTGLEDMDLAKRLLSDGGYVGYVSDSCVYHLHEERWTQIRNRFEREALALQSIMPQIHVGLYDTLRYIFSSVALDIAEHWRTDRSLLFWEIAAYRIVQYWGTYRGNHIHRQLSRKMKERYFYPR